MPLKKEQEQKQSKSLSLTKKPPIIYLVTVGSLAPDTKVAYQSHINYFLSFFKITHIDPLKEYSPKLVRQMLMDYVIHLRDVKKISRSLIAQHCAAVSHFFYMIRDDDHRLDWAKVRMEFPPEERIHKDRAYTVEEIQKMLAVCSRLREKVIILLFESTGLRMGGVPNLKIGDLHTKITPQGKVYYITIYSSSSHSYDCPCTPECAHMIDQYLKERSDAGEVLQNDSPLIRNLYNIKDVKAKPVTKDNIKYLVGRIIKQSGIKNTFQFTGEAKRTRGFRKFYKTQAELAGMKPINVETTHGHSTGVAGKYFGPTEKELLEDYMSHAADALTIDQTYRLLKKVDKLKSHKSEIWDQVRARINDLESKMSELTRITNIRLEVVGENHPDLRKTSAAAEDKDWLLNDNIASVPYVRGR